MPQADAAADMDCVGEAKPGSECIPEVEAKLEPAPTPTPTPSPKLELEPEPEPETYEDLGTFADEVAQHSYTARGVMVGATAIARAEYGPGRGRVLCISPHPESTHAPPSLANSSEGSIRRFHRIVQRAVLAVAPRAAPSRLSRS